jgi:hypothetical protein
MERSSRIREAIPPQNEVSGEPATPLELGGTAGRTPFSAPGRSSSWTGQATVAADLPHSFADSATYRR